MMFDLFLAPCREKPQVLQTAQLPRRAATLPGSESGARVLNVFHTTRHFEILARPASEHF
jgi:hypothetical protein